MKPRGSRSWCPMIAAYGMPSDGAGYLYANTCLLRICCQGSWKGLTGHGARHLHSGPRRDYLDWCIFHGRLAQLVQSAWFTPRRSQVRILYRPLECLTVPHGQVRAEAPFQFRRAGPLFAETTERSSVNPVPPTKEVGHSLAAGSSRGVGPIWKPASLYRSSRAKKPPDAKCPFLTCNTF